MDHSLCLWFILFIVLGNVDIRVVHVLWLWFICVLVCCIFYGRGLYFVYGFGL